MLSHTRGRCRGSGRGWRRVCCGYRGYRGGFVHEACGGRFGLLPSLGGMWSGEGLDQGLDKGFSRGLW